LKQKSRQLFVLKNLEKKSKSAERKKVIKHEKKYTKLLPSECNPRDQNDISSQNASKREQKKTDFVKRD